MDELMKKVQEIKSLCADRLDARTAEGNELGVVFEEVEAIIEKLKSKTK